MRLQYCQIEGGNFGDDLNPWLWTQLAPQLFTEDARTEFLGIGTILADTYPAGTSRVVFGSGAGYKRPPIINQEWMIYCVRGPRTAQLLKIDPAYAVTDSAALVATLPWELCGQEFDVSYMPHHYSAELGDWRSVCQQAGVNYIAPNADVNQTIERIRRSKLLVTEALHGAVVADALRIPWIAVRAYGHILPLKWHDWCESLGMSYQPRPLLSLWQTPLSASKRVAHLAKRIGGYLPGGKEKWRWAPLRVHGEKRIEQIATQLCELTNVCDGTLSRHEMHECALERLIEKLDKLQRDFTRHEAPATVAA